jgi:GT2 family glycosyltransferase
MRPISLSFSDKIVSFILNTYFSFVNGVFGLVMVYGEFQITKREAFKKVGGFSEHLAASEDYDLFRRLNKKVGKVKFVKRLKVYHTGRRIHKVGWVKLLFRWFSNWLSVILVNKAKDKEWEEFVDAIGLIGDTRSRYKSRVFGLCEGELKDKILQEVKLPVHFVNQKC